MTDILIIGEAWGKEEDLARAPFVGTSGRLLTRLLADAGIERSSCFLTNVFNQHPYGDDVNEFCGPAATAIPNYPAHHGARHVHRRFSGELDRLGREVVLHRPKVCICLGNTAMWAMLGKTGIARYRGTTQSSTHTRPGVKCLPTYHPAAVVRDWSLRATVVMDLIKAKKESAYADVRYPERTFWIEPDLDDLYEFERKYLKDCTGIAVDIETAGSHVTTIGFAPRSDVALVVPFLDPRGKGRSYWSTAETECEAWRFVSRVLSSPHPKYFQNGLFDIAFLWRAMGLKVRNAAEDTMLLHHSLQPESLKGLGYLASIYTGERAWKHMRTSTTIKQDA